MTAQAMHERTGAGREAAALRREAAILRRAQHPGVIELRGVSDDGDQVVLTTVAPQGTALADAVLTLEEVAGVAAVLATTIADLHDIGIAHGAVGPDAVVLDADGRPVLVAFECATWIEGPEARRPASAAAVADDRALGGLIGDILARCAPPDVVGPLERPRRRRWRRHASGGAQALARWAQEAAAGHVAARALADAMALEVPGACLPHRSALRGAPPEPADGGLTSDTCETDAPAASISDDAIDAWLLEPAPAVDAPPPVAGPTGRYRPAWIRWAAAAVFVVVAAGAVLWARGAPRPAQATTARHPAPRMARAVPPQHPTTTAVVAIRAPLAPATPFSFADGVLTVGGSRYAVGEAGDVVATGRWWCAGPTLAILRPATGEVWVWTRWPTGPDPISATLVGTVTGSTTLSAGPDHDNPACDDLVVGRPGGPGTELRAWEHP